MGRVCSVASEWALFTNSRVSGSTLHAQRISGGAQFFALPGAPADASDASGAASVPYTHMLGVMGPQVPQAGAAYYALGVYDEATGVFSNVTTTTSAAATASTATAALEAGDCVRCGGVCCDSLAEGFVVTPLEASPNCLYNELWVDADNGDRMLWVGNLFVQVGILELVIARRGVAWHWIRVASLVPLRAPVTAGPAARDLRPLRRA